MHFIVASTDTNVIPPVETSNVWAELFVRRNTGISYGEVAGSFDYIMEQYKSASSKLEDAESSLMTFDREYDLAASRSELDVKSKKQTDYQNLFVDTSLRLRNETEGLKSLVGHLAAQETSDGLWVGSLDVADAGGIRRRMLEEPDRQILDAIIQARDRVVEMEARLPATRLEHDQDFLQESLKSKMQVLLGSLDELPSLEVGAFSVGEALRGAVRDGNTEPQQVSLTMPASALVAREIASLQVRQNLLEPRHRAMLMVVERLRSEYDSLQVVASERDSKMRRILARKDIIDKSYARFLANYQATRKGADDLGLSITTLAPRVADYGAAFDGLRIETASLRADLADLELRRSRLARQVDIYQSTFSKFQKLAEDARIAKAERPSDLKIVARAVEARRVPEEVPKRILALAVGVGLVISVFLAFFLEYLEKAKDRLAQET